MKKTTYYILLVLFNISLSVSLMGQLKQEEYQSSNIVKLKPREIRKLTFIELVKGEKKFPDSYLLGLRDNNLILATDISAWVDDPLFVKSEIALKNYDHLIILERTEKMKKMALWGALLGAGGYWLVNKNSKATPLELRNKTLLGQKPNNGIIESVIGGITGFALGTIIGRHLAKKKISVKNQQRVIRQLKEVSFY